MPNNRQIALLIWATVALLFALRAAEIRKSLRDVGRTLLQPILLVPVTAFLVFVSLLVFSGARLDLWNRGLATDTGFWVAGSGIVLLSNFDRATKGDRFFRHSLAKILGLTILVEVVLEISILSLPLELAIVPIATVLAVFEVVAIRQPEHERIAGCAKSFLAALGLALLAVGLVRALTNFDGLDLAHLGRQALLPIWLTAGLLPFVYLLALYAKYESIGSMIDWRSDQSWRRRAILKGAVFREYGLKAHSLGQFTNPAAMRLADATTWSQARQAISRHRSDIAARQAEEREAEERLDEYSGVAGVDDDGRQLDRREFDETCAALRWLHTCHMGWWRRENRYTEGLLDRISTPNDSHGLAPGAGYTEVVATGGATWYGWRRTITGWVFAIGATDSPPDQWLYDGADPPTGPPLKDPRWGDTPFGGDASPNWE